MAEGALPTMGGIIEIDETFLGGKQIGKGVKYGKNSKQVVVGIRQRKEPLRQKHTADAKRVSIQPVIEAHVNPSAVEFVMTDTTSATDAALKALGLHEKHREINHIARKHVDGIVHTNTIESAFSLLKRDSLSYRRMVIIAAGAYAMQRLSLLMMYLLSDASHQT